MEGKRFVVVIQADGRMFVDNYEEEKERIWQEAYAEGLEEGRAEIASIEKDAYMKGYLSGKRDGEMSKKDIPEEVRKHIEEALRWMES